MHDYSHQRLPLLFTGIHSINRDTNGAYETTQSDMFYVSRTKFKFIDNDMEHMAYSDECQ